MRDAPMRINPLKKKLDPDNIIMEQKAEIARLTAEVTEHRDLGMGYHRQALEMKEDNARLRADKEDMAATIEKQHFEINALRAALWEATTNGEWTEGEQCGDWKISKEVYETMRDALAALMSTVCCEQIAIAPLMAVRPSAPAGRLQPAKRDKPGRGNLKEPL